MKIMIEACVYNAFKNVVISIDSDSDGALCVLVSRTDDNGNAFVLDGLTVDTVRQEPRRVK